MKSDDLETQISNLTNRVRGSVLRPRDTNYEMAREVWNTRISKKPEVIVQCAGVADVIRTVDFARQTNLTLAVKGGGHHVSGIGVCDDGIVLDMGEMDSVDVAPNSGEVAVEGGATWGDLYYETEIFGLGTTGGNYPHIGVAGLTLGGGWGWLGRRFGLSIDNLRSAKMVTADGSFVMASENENSDLFWGIRGGGGNFGVVTSLTFDLYRIGPDVLAGEIIHPVENAKELLKFYRDFMETAPDELTIDFRIMRTTSDSDVPEVAQNETVAIMGVVYSGDITEGESILESIRQFSNPMVDTIHRQSFGEFKGIYDSERSRSDLLGYEDRYYSESLFLQSLSNDAIDTIVNYVSNPPEPHLVMGLEPMGGAISDVPIAETAFPHRKARYLFEIFPRWTSSEKDEEIISWTREFHQAMEPHSTGGEYVNLAGEIDERKASCFYGVNLDRLHQIKQDWDPTNLFNNNHNILPE